LDDVQNRNWHGGKVSISHVWAKAELLPGWYLELSDLLSERGKGTTFFFTLPSEELRIWTIRFRKKQQNTKCDSN
jgi:hypothetical protein